MCSQFIQNWRDQEFWCVLHKTAHTIIPDVLQFCSFCTTVLRLSANVTRHVGIFFDKRGLGHTKVRGSQI